MTPHPAMEPEMQPAPSLPATADPDVVEIRHWSPLRSARRGSPRATLDVRAKIAHTTHQGRRLELFITGPVVERLGWAPRGRVEVNSVVGSKAAYLRLQPSHRGIKLLQDSSRSATLRVCLYGDFLRSTICAPVRAVPFRCEGSTLFVDIPLEWTTAWAPQAEGASP